ncbi:MgtC/SapB family protein [bacterium]|nr:MgtC/SapB family protein [bacterium]
MDLIISKFNSPLMVPLWYSVICGILVGLEREIKKKDAGIKTTIFICLGACLFTFISLNIPGANDSSRTIASIVSGVGFIGGGVIIFDSDKIMGLTSAAIMWMSAGIGVLCGLGFYFEALMSSFTVVFLDFGFDLIKYLIKGKN